MADFRMLGPVELWIEGEEVALGPPRQRHVLAVLMYSAGRIVEVEVLVDRVWDETPPAQVRNVLYSYIARLRRALRPHVTAAEAVPLRRGRGGYVLDIEPEAVDCQRFQQMLVRSRRPGVSDQVRRSLLQAALDQWRGTPLTGLSGDWAKQVRHGLEQHRINALVECTDIDLRTGEYLRVIDQLHDLLAEYPLSEVLAGRLMRALHQAGRSAEALDCYGSLRQRLVNDLGAEPGPELRGLHQQTLRATSAQTPIDFPPPPPPPSQPWRGLRPHFTRLIGRDDERSDLHRMLVRERLVTVTGVGGCGKTALALHVAHETVRRLDLSGAALSLVALTSTEQVTNALRALLGSADEGNQDSMPAVEQIIAARPWLLVLDNCEHVAAEVADVAARLLSSCPELTILVTSRQPLGIVGEAVLALHPLAVPEHPADLTAPAAELFVERARQAASPVVIASDDVEHVATICRRLDGLPLALELVAARVRTFTLHDLADRLGTDLTLLFRTTTGGDYRHHTLDATLDWSFQLLSDHQQRLFARLSVFVGEFTTAEAEAVCGFPPLVGDTIAATLAALVDQSLVQPDDRAGSRRYHLLEVVRIFAAQRLAESGEHTVCGHRHIDHWLNRARHIDQLSRYHDRVLSLQALEADAANLRGCLEYGLASAHSLDAAEIIARTFEFWLVNNGYLAEGRGFLDRALREPELAQRPEMLTLLRFHQALLAGMSGDSRRSLDLMRRVVDDLCRHRPRECLEGRAALLYAKCTLLDPSVLDEVDPTVAMALSSTSIDDIRIVLNAAGAVLNTWGRYHDAAALDTEHRKLGPPPDASSAAAILTAQIEAALGQDDTPSARALVDQLRTHLAGISHAAEHDSPTRAIAQTYLHNGETDTAVRFLSDAWNSLHTNHPLLARRFTYLQVLLAESQRRTGHLSQAVRTLDNALHTSTTSTDYRQRFPAVLTAALIAADLGDHAASERLANRWDTLRRGLGLPSPIAFANQAASLLDLDPTPPASPAAGFSWDHLTLETTIASAQTWCQRQLARTN